MENEDKIEDVNAIEKSEPGASRYGNFINYYNFHSVDERVQQLPQGVWRSSYGDKQYIAFDVGCNAGDLTLALHNFLLSEQKQKEDVFLLGIDLDSTLIKRANEKNTHPSKVTFECLDFFSEICIDRLKQYLTSHKRSRFDVSFAFSITMWIHLNHGDSGLQQFLQVICEMSDMVVIEPQLWKCYRNASRRLRRAKKGDFPLLDKLTYRGNVEEHIVQILEHNCGFQKVSISDTNDWQRKLLIYKRMS